MIKIFNSIVIISICHFLLILKNKVWHYNQLKKKCNNRMSKEVIDKIDSELIDVCNRSSSSVLFSIVCILVIYILLIIYVNLASKYSYSPLFSSGIILSLWLVLIGNIIKKIHNRIEYLMYQKNYLNDNDKTLLIILISIFFIIISYKYEKDFSFMMISIIMGRFVWIDSELKAVIKDIRRIYTNSCKEVRISAFRFILPILLAQMLYLMGLDIVLCLIAMSLFMGIYPLIIDIIIKLLNKL